MDELHEYSLIDYKSLLNWFPESPAMAFFSAIITLLLLAAAINFVMKFIVVKSIQRAFQDRGANWVVVLLKGRTISRFVNVFPAMVILNGIVHVPYLDLSIAHVIQMVMKLLIVLTLTLSFTAALGSTNQLYELRVDAQKKPIKGYLQLVSLVAYVVCFLVLLGVVLDKSVMNLLAGLGALAAVLMLIFQNTILSLVASVQVSSYDMVRVGDWIEMPALHADGTVIDMSLHMISVQNFDNTITVIPTNRLVSDTFRNWRGMSDSGARRIKRPIYIDQSSVRFLAEADYAKMNQFSVLREYLSNKEKEIKQWNNGLREKGLDDVNNRHLTNLGTFRAYVYFYLRNHPEVRENLSLLVRQLDPTSKGVPLEIYCFTNTTVWNEYERIQSDIFDHLIAIIPQFGLRIYQEPSGFDMQEMVQSLQNKPH